MDQALPGVDGDHALLGRERRTKQVHDLRQRIGCQLQEAALPDRIKVWEALDAFCLRREEVASALCHSTSSTEIGGIAIAAVV